MPLWFTGCICIYRYKYSYTCKRIHECLGMLRYIYLFMNTSWTGDALWRHRIWSTLAQVMAYCQTAPRYYLNRWWQIMIGEVSWHSPLSKFTGNSKNIHHWCNHLTWYSGTLQLHRRSLVIFYYHRCESGNWYFKVIFAYQRGQWVKAVLDWLDDDPVPYITNSATLSLLHQHTKKIFFIQFHTEH